MQLPTWLAQVIKSGEVTLFTGDVEALQIKAENNKIELKTDNRDFLKTVVGSAQNQKAIWRKLAKLKLVASELKAEGVTYTLSYKGTRVLTIGSEAKPKFSRIVTGTDAIEINSMRKLLEISV